MLYCNRPFDSIYLKNHFGDVILCSWTDYHKGIIGNLNKNSLDEIWHGEKAEELRNMFRKGDFSLCSKVGCPYLQNNELPDIEYNENDERWTASESPKMMCLAFDFTCNQACPTCRNDFFRPTPEYTLQVNTVVDRILPDAGRALRIMGSGHGDTFASPYYMNFLEKLRPQSSEMQIVLETNGVCFDEDHWKRIEHLAECQLTLIITTNSYTKEIYDQISVGGNLEKLKENQLFMKKLRQQGKLNWTLNAMVVQEKNYMEIPDFIERSLDIYGFDEVHLRPVYNWGNLTDAEYWKKDVLNPLHPDHEEYVRIINLPIVKDNPRVYNFAGETEHEARPYPSDVEGTEK